MVNFLFGEFVFKIENFAEQGTRGCGANTSAQTPRVPVVEGWLMHRGGGVAGGGTGSAGSASATTGTRALELEARPPSMPGAPSFTWGAVFAGHHATGMMQPPLSAAAEYAPAPAHHAAHPAMPMDLHVSPAFSYYRYNSNGFNNQNNYQLFTVLICTGLCSKDRKTMNISVKEGYQKTR